MSLQIYSEQNYSMGNNQCLPCVKTAEVDNPGHKRNKTQKKEVKNGGRKIEGQMDGFGSPEKAPLIEPSQVPSSSDTNKLQESGKSSHYTEKQPVIEQIDEEEDEDRGNMLGKLGSSVISYEKNDASDEEISPEEAKFGLNDMDHDRCTSFFQSAKGRDQMAVVSDYILNAEMRKIEDPNRDATVHDYQKALFYLYGNCEDFNEAFGKHGRYMAHSLLKRFELYTTFDDVKKVLSKQVIKTCTEENEEQIDTEEQILRFLTKHSKYGMKIKEIELVAEDLNSRLYKVIGTEEELAVKVPKLISDRRQEYMGFLDIIFETQLVQFLKRGATKKYFFPQVYEEIFLVNEDTKTILNYMTIVEFPNTSLISMLAGPTAMGKNARDSLTNDDEGYRSQEIFTQEKYIYLYYQGLLLLEHFYDQGISHGHINGLTLKIADNYTFSLGEFELATCTPGYASLSEQAQATVSLQVRGFNKATVSKDFVKTLHLNASQKAGANLDLGDPLQQVVHDPTEAMTAQEEAEFKQQQKIFAQDFTVRDLIQEDWRDLVACFFFPKLSKCLTDPKIKHFIQKTNGEMLEKDQEPHVIKLLVEKCQRFFENNIDVLEELLENLKEEQMFEAVIHIASEQLQIGRLRECGRMQAFAYLNLGEVIAKEYLTSQKQCDKALSYMKEAADLYTHDTKVLSTEEYSRVNLTLSTLYRFKGDQGQSKRHLELAKDKVTDKKVLLQFYQESANVLNQEEKYHNALDSQKKAIELAKQIYRDDDYALYECQIALAEAYDKAEMHEEAQEVFDKCFQAFDGRDGNSSRMSIRSALSRALSIKTRTASVVAYGNRKSVAGAPGKSDVMQRVAVQLRSKQEYGRAERMMLKAIQVKKQILKTEADEDIAYLYNELAVTYQGHDDLDNAIKCVKKQLLIFEELKKTNTLQYVQCLSFVGEMYRDQEMTKEAIEALTKAIDIHEQITNNNNVGKMSMVSALSVVPVDLERTQIMKMLAEEQIKSGNIREGIDVAKQALFTQQNFFHGIVNAQVQETMLLLAEALTVDFQIDDALKMYQEILDARGSGADSPKDIYRAMAPLLTQKGNYIEAAECLTKVLETEQQGLAKVGILTKIAGNYKKADKSEKCLENSLAAYELIKVHQGEMDLQSCKCLLNLANVYLYFEKTEDATKTFQHYIDMFNSQNGEDGKIDWSKDDQFVKLKTFADGCLDTINGEGEDEGDEYYDEEDESKKSERKNSTAQE